MSMIRGAWSDETWYGAVTVDGIPLDPRPSLKVRNHSPDGFAWGYGGSGPAQLALAVLLACGAPAPLALRHYQGFKTQFLQRLDSRAAFEIEVDVLNWLAARERVL